MYFGKLMLLLTICYAYWLNGLSVVIVSTPFGITLVNAAVATKLSLSGGHCVLRRFLQSQYGMIEDASSKTMSPLFTSNCSISKNVCSLQGSGLQFFFVSQYIGTDLTELQGNWQNYAILVTLSTLSLGELFVVLNVLHNDEPISTHTEFVKWE